MGQHSVKDKGMKLFNGQFIRDESLTFGLTSCVAVTHFDSKETIK